LHYQTIHPHINILPSNKLSLHIHHQTYNSTYSKTITINNCQVLITTNKQQFHVYHVSHNRHTIYHVMMFNLTNNQQTLVHSYFIILSCSEGYLKVIRSLNLFSTKFVYFHNFQHFLSNFTKQSTHVRTPQPSIHTAHIWSQ